METGELVQTFKGHRSVVECLTVNTEGTLLISGSGDRSIRVWDIATGKETLVI